MNCLFLYVACSLHACTCNNLAWNIVAFRAEQYIAAKAASEEEIEY